MKRFSAVTKSILLVPLLSGCSSLLFPPSTPPKYFVLNKTNWHGDASPSRSKSKDKSINIELPFIYPPLNSQRVGVMVQQNQLDFYADMEWADQLSRLIQESLIQSLQDSQLYDNVTRNIESLLPSLILKIDVRKFYVDQTTTPHPMAQVEYYVTALDSHTKETKGEKVFAASIPLPYEADDNSKEDIALTLNNANQQVLRSIIEWSQNH